MKIKNSNKVLIKNTYWSLLTKVLSMLFYFWADTIYAHYLGIDQYAEWAFYLSISTIFFYIGWFGINTSAKVFIAREDNEKSCFWAAFFLRLFCSLVISIIFFVFIKSFHYKIPYERLKRELIFIPFLTFLNSFTEFFKSIYIGSRKYTYLFFTTVLEYAGYCLFSISFFRNNNSVRNIIYAYISTGILLLVCNFYFSQRLFGSLIPFWKNKKKCLAILKYALPLVMSSIGGLILTEMDTFMLSYFSTNREVSVYSIAKHICSKSTHVNMALWTGTVSSLAIITKENYFEKKKQFQIINRINMIISMIICIGFLFFGTFVIRVIYGKDFNVAGTILSILIPYHFMYCISSFQISFLEFQGKAKTNAYWYISVIMLNLILNFILIPRFGASGAAVATSFSLFPYTLYSVFEVQNLFSKKNYSKFLSFRKM